MISPQGTVWLGTVPWDSSYRNVWYEGMLNKQLIISQFMTMQTSNYTYIREDTNIRVPYNADSIYGINYCMYQNDGVWFCAFVNTITYVNNATSLLHLAEDVWHTWGMYLNVKSCMVMREHVNSDNLGEWRAPEPAIELEQVVLAEQEFNEVSYNSIVVGVNAIPHLKTSGSIFAQHTEDDFDGSDPVAGGYYNAIYSGAAYYGFTSSQISSLSNFLNNLNMCGAAESICCMFMVPSAFLTTDSDFRVTAYASGGVDGSFPAPQYHSDGYVPRNNKCLTFPYAYASITDNSGGNMDVKYEDCNTWGLVSYRLQQGLDPTAQIFVTLRDYMRQSINFSHMMPVAQNPQCSWVYSAYQNWAAQNADVISNKKMWNALNMAAGGLMTGIGVALLATGGGAPVGGPLSALGLTTIEAAGLTTAMAGVGKMYGAGSNVTGLAAEIDAQSKIPNHTAGGSSSNSLQGIARNEGACIFYGLQRKSAERLDAFFDMFGYAIDTVKVPNLTGRPSWNYVKTVGAQMGGTIPADRLSIMNKCFDDGITFWHNSDIGNYALNNSI